MKKINFKKISIKNFLSVGNSPVTIDFKPGLHIITGINKDKEDRRNGVGKSTVADGIYFAVFGETLRDLKKEFIINNINKKTCEVCLEAEIQTSTAIEQIRIIRTLDPSKCFVFINEEDKTLDSISNTNSFITEKFDCTPEIFQNCVIMTLNNTIPFMAKKKQEKRKFIEDIFNLSIFGLMLTEAKNQLNEKKKSFDVITAKYDEIKNNLDSLEKQKNRVVEEQKKKQEKYLTRKKSNELEINDIQEKLNSFSAQDKAEFNKIIEESNKKIEKVDNKINEIRHDFTTNLTLIQELSKKIKTIGTDADLCPVCLRAVDEKDKNHIKKEKQKYQEQIKDFEKDNLTLKEEEEKYKSARTLLIKKIDEIKEQIHEVSLEKQKKDSLVARLDQLKQWQKELEVDLTELNKNTTNFDTIIQESQDKQNKTKQQIDDIKSNLNKLDTVKFIMSEEGVKSYIVKKILQLFNTKLAYYLKKMDANCLCTFNEYFEESIIDDKGKECSYFNFSGAERKNIDLACLFAFMDIRRLQGNVSFNFSIYDELFDSSLDEKGVELVINILKERVEKFNECAMVISHRKESIKAATGDIIFLEKSNGITKKVDYIEYKSSL
jgi:DNA repair exonuclease SbcCD ATPase subunit